MIEEFLEPADPSVLDERALAMKSWIEDHAHKCPYLAFKDTDFNDEGVPRTKVFWCSLQDVYCLKKNCTR